MTWDGLVTKYHSIYIRELSIDNRIEAYIRSRVIKKTLESISLEYRQGLREDGNAIEDVSSILGRISSNDAGIKTKD